jgi:methylated-DNA-protein-cysteine methyltransferase-like protein
MVGYAMNAAHALPDVPAHRVVNRQGLLTGKYHFATPTLMEELLLAEGVLVKNDQVQDFPTRFWNPEIELGV